MYGAFDIDSMPPVTMSSASPARIIESAISTARMDDAQTLLIVSAGTSIGRPAPTAACRAGPGALEPGANRDRAQLGRLLVLQPAAEPPEGRAHGGDDDAASHEKSV